MTPGRTGVFRVRSGRLVPMAKFQYGGQALIEGVLMRGRNALAVAIRHPDGSIVWAVERLDLGLRARRAMKLPLLRGLVLLYDTLVTGTRWLVRSATLQALEEGEDGAAPSAGGAAPGSATKSLLGSALRSPLVWLLAAEPTRSGDEPSEDRAGAPRTRRSTTRNPTKPSPRRRRRNRASAKATEWPSAECSS